MMKKVVKLLGILAILFILLPNNVSAKTLGQLRKEYNTLQEKYNSNKDKLNYTESQISSAKARIQSIYTEIDQIEKDIQNINDEISKLNSSIIEKDHQTKELMKFFQLSQGESTYLEYIFEADSITDFIYRISVTEQLSKYNDELIDQMNKMIEENNKNIENLHKKEKSLTALQDELADKVIILNSEKQNLTEISRSLEDEIKAELSILDYYEKAGCSEDQDINSCAQGLLPAGTKFWRPLNYGWVTQEVGGRINPVTGQWQANHSGMDMGSGDKRIYSISDGQVSYVSPIGYNGGMGNYICIQHNINGQYYTSTYMHLSSQNVYQGQIVTKNTVIGIMGTTGRSTGEHLHLSINTGLKCFDQSHLVNPRNYINFPSKAQPGNIYPNFYDRTSYYD